MSSPRVSVSVIIPTLEEAATIATCLDHLASQGADEVIVADGDSADGTADLAQASGARVVRSPRGRGVQQNRGASQAGGDVLLFLHADCRLEAGSVSRLRRFVGRCPKVPGGCFRMRVDAPDLPFRTIDAAAHLRAGLAGLPYGDQGVFVPRWAFDRVGGFPEVPLMDDVYLALRLRSLGRIALLPERIYVSPRRWRRHGILGQSLRNWSLTAAAASGVSPGVLSRFYPIVR
ncbi:TIGR04283 family arsenosugar biosynthesis glycosyltransferase [Tautonia plasticadhaerens]|uniref:PGL/p-HBAD biosynthesis glycosyltransferase n=1 Tax=Tautonia plasticadhaerens TaxID=2527974 RepID=A0A518GWT6_9BACT|nr:TIGR04283 family arsenosugar biosynthesis glycosyltransferase [Tautonia plasticadhaerens]QDV33058.1 PGL/p-HBAD biosynthesis glycosyltransferase [Tautonia plasticadhaerens]